MSGDIGGGPDLSQHARSVADRITVTVAKDKTTVDAAAVADKRLAATRFQHAVAMSSLIGRRNEGGLAADAVGSLPASPGGCGSFCFSPGFTALRRTLLVEEFPALLQHGVSTLEDVRQDGPSHYAGHLSSIAFRASCLNGSKLPRDSVVRAPVHDGEWNGSVAVERRRSKEETPSATRTAPPRPTPRESAVQVARVSLSGCGVEADGRLSTALVPSAAQHVEHLGSVGGYELGFDDADMSQWQQWKEYALDQLTLMNFDVPTIHSSAAVGGTAGAKGAGSHTELHEDSVRNGALLCQLLEFVVAFGRETERNMSLLGVQGGSKLQYSACPTSIAAVRDNFGVALTAVRRLSREHAHLFVDQPLSADVGGDASFTSGEGQSPPAAVSGVRLTRVKGMIPFPPAFLHLNVDAILKKRSMHEFWGLVALVIHNFVGVVRFRAADSAPATPCHFKSIPLVAVAARPSTTSDRVAGVSSAAPFPVNCIPPLFLRSTRFSSKRTNTNSDATYRPSDWMLLEAAACSFIFEHDLLPHCGGASAEDTQNHVPLFAQLAPLRASFVSQQLSSRRHNDQQSAVPTRPATLACAAVMPFLRNGTLLCSVVSLALSALLRREQQRVLRNSSSFSMKPLVTDDDVDLKTHHNPRTATLCLANISVALSALAKLPKHIINPSQLWDPVSVFDGDREFLLLLLEDVMRLYCGAPPRGAATAAVRVTKSGATATVAFVDPNDSLVHARGVAAQPFIPPAIARHLLDARADKILRDNNGAEAGFISDELVHHHANRTFVRREMQEFAGSSLRDPATTAQVEAESLAPRRLPSSVAVRREGSVGTTATAISSATGTFVVTSANPTPAAIRPRLNTVTNAVSSGRSIAPHDEQRDELLDSVEEVASDPQALPSHLAYLANMAALDAAEMDALVGWVRAKLGASYVHKGVTFDFSMRDFVAISEPCMIFADGVILFELVSTLTYRKLDVRIEERPKTVASRKNNIRRVLQYLLETKKLQRDAPFIEEALVAGNALAVVYLLRTLVTAFKAHTAVKKR